MRPGLGRRDGIYFTAPDFGGDSFNWSDNVHFCMFDSHGGNWDDVLHIAFASQNRFCLSASSEWRLGRAC